MHVGLLLKESVATATTESSLCTDAASRTSSQQGRRTKEAEHAMNLDPVVPISTSSLSTRLPPASCWSESLGYEENAFKSPGLL